MTLRDPIAAIFIFALSATTFVLSGEYSGGAELFPRGISAIMMLCAGLLFIRGIWRPEKGEPLTGGERIRLGISVALTLIYVAAIVPVGFLISSLLYVPLAAYAMGLRRHVMIWITTILSVSSIYYAFEFIFHAPLPEGLFLRAF